MHDVVARGNEERSNLLLEAKVKLVTGASAPAKPKLFAVVVSQRLTIVFFGYRQIPDETFVTLQ